MKHEMVRLYVALSAAGRDMMESGAVAYWAAAEGGDAQAAYHIAKARKAIDAAAAAYAAYDAAMTPAYEPDAAQ